MYLNKTTKHIIFILLIAVYVLSFSIGSYAADNNTGNQFVYIVEPKYECVDYAEEGMTSIHKGLKGWYVNAEGREVTPPLDHAPEFRKGVAIVELDGKRGLIDKTGKYIIPLGKYEFIRDNYDFTEGFIQVSNDRGYRTGNVWGLVDTTTGREILKPEYSIIEPFSEGLALVRKSGDSTGNEKDKYGYIDKTGNFVIPLKFQCANSFSEGIAPARITQNGKYGYIDKSGEFVIKPQWDQADQFKDGYAQIADGLLRGLINKSGFEVVKPLSLPFPAYWIHEDKIKMLYENKLYTFENNGKYSVVDSPVVTEEDRTLILSLGDFYDGLAKAECKGKVGYINKIGELIIPQIWDYGTDFNNGTAYVQLHDENGSIIENCIINTSGEVLYKDNYDSTWEFSEGICNYYKDGKYYTIDTTGKLLFTSEWDKMGQFNDGLARVNKDYMYGYVDKTGKIAIELPEYGEPFNGGYAMVREKGKWGFIDKTGRIVAEPQWDYIEQCSDGYAVVTKDGKLGMIKLLEDKR